MTPLTKNFWEPRDIRTRREREERCLKKKKKKSGKVRGWVKWKGGVG
jgi:hypothetical protein